MLGAGSARILWQSVLESTRLSLTGPSRDWVWPPGAQLILVGLDWGERPIDLSLDGRVLGVHHEFGIPVHVNSA